MEGQSATENEERFVEKLNSYLNKYFEVRNEVWSKCGNGRIDVLLKINPNIYFGIECKKNNSKRGEEMGEFVKQAIRYSKYEFEVEPKIYKRIPILIAPPLSYKYFLLNQKTELFKSHSAPNGNATWHQDRHPDGNEHHSFNGFLGAWGIGELRKGANKYGNFCFISSSNKTIWSSEVYKSWARESMGKLVMKGFNNKCYEYWVKKIEKLWA